MFPTESTATALSRYALAAMGVGTVTVKAAPATMLTLVLVDDFARLSDSAVAYPVVQPLVSATAVQHVAPLHVPPGQTMVAAAAFKAKPVAQV
jgi:hypothetical protein